MAEENTVTMTVENIDHLFPEIVVNGESHISDRYVPPTIQPQVVTPVAEDTEEEEPSTPAQVVQGQDVHAVELNDVLHDFVDPSVTQGLADEIQTRRNADTALQNSINTINSKIPNQASAENQLADKNFVNSSIATNTANFLGTYTTLQEIEAIPNPTNNDYAYWDTTDSAGNTVYKRYKYNGESNEWLYEYDLNNSSFTAEQWATINSGLTQQSVDEDIQEAISQVGSGITVYPTQEELEQDLPNLSDGDIVGTYGDDNTNYNDAPLGSVMSYLGTTDPSDGKWLICDGRDTTGTAIELETHYPSLYMFLGGTNVLPEIFDHSRPSAWETITISTNSVSPTTMQYDGVLNVNLRTSTNKRVYVNGVRVTAETIADMGLTYTVEVKKGDVVYATGTIQDTCYAVWYKSHKIIKAVSSVDTYNIPSSEIAQIEQYFDEGQQRAQSYSTTETLTGGKWIDGKPIYRNVFKITSTISSSTWGWGGLSSSIFADVDTLIECKGTLIENGTNSYSVCCYARKSAGFFVQNNNAPANSYFIVEYTKTTD